MPPAGETGIRLPGGGLGVDPSTLGGGIGVDTSTPGARAGGTGTAPVSLQATRHARRVYVGGLPDVTSDVAVGAFFSRALAAVEGAVADAPGEPVLNVYLNQEKKFAFIEFRSVEECSNALALDGVLMESAPLRVRRPNDYNAGAAVGLGPSQPSPELNLAAVGLVANAGGAAVGSRQPAVPPEDLPNRLFIGGLPYFLNETMVKELVEAFGPTKSFMLVTDRETGNSKGYGFFVYQDQSVTDVAMQGLHGMQMGEKTLTVRRATGERRDGFGAGAARRRRTFRRRPGRRRAAPRPGVAAGASHGAPRGRRRRRRRDRRAAAAVVEPALGGCVAGRHAGRGGAPRRRRIRGYRGGHARGAREVRRAGGDGDSQTGGGGCFRAGARAGVRAVRGRDGGDGGENRAPRAQVRGENRRRRFLRRRRVRTQSLLKVTWEETVTVQ